MKACIKIKVGSELVILFNISCDNRNFFLQLAKSRKMISIIYGI